MKNPFQYGGVIGSEAFCNRRRERADLQRAMENGEKLFVYSERRMGKTSLVRLVLDRLPKRGYLGVYVDLWPTDGEESFVAALARGLAEAMGPSPEKVLSAARTFFGRLTPTLTLDTDGKTVVSFGMHRGAKVGPALDEVLAAPARMAKEGRRKVVIVLDEFQQIMEYGGDLVERRLRSVVQHQPDVSFIFLGSRKHLIQKMFLDGSRPLYRSAGHYPLGPISVEEWLPFIWERFYNAKKKISDEQIREIVGLTDGHPFYTQHLCHALWELADIGRKIPDEMIADALRMLLEREGYAYTTLWESLTSNQRRFLEGLARSGEPVQPFASEFLQRHRLGTASSAQRAVESLLARDVIDRDEGSYMILDRFFRLWIQRTQLLPP
jgi:hypothetical protein